MPRVLLADGLAALIAATGIALIARVPAGASEPDAYRLRILGALLVAVALFLGGFVTASWMTD